MDTATPSPSTPPPSAASTEDKTAAIVAYLTLIGFIVAILIHNGKKTKLGAFHLRQVLGLFITGLAVVVCEFVLVFIPILGWLAIVALWITVFVIWLMGLISAIGGQMKPAPILGPLYQKWFGTTFD
jgi:uncharacterized membrane protein